MDYYLKYEHIMSIFYFYVYLMNIIFNIVHLVNIKLVISIVYDMIYLMIMYILSEIGSILIQMIYVVIFSFTMSYIVMKTLRINFNFKAKNNELDDYLQTEFKKIKSRFSHLKTKLITFHDEKNNKYAMAFYNAFNDTIYVNTASKDTDKEILLGFLGHEITHALSKNKNIIREFQKYSVMMFLGIFNKVIIVMYSLQAFLLYGIHSGHIEMTEGYKVEMLYSAIIIIGLMIPLHNYLRKWEEFYRLKFNRTKEDNHKIEYLCDQGSKVLMGKDLLSKHFLKENNPDSPSHPSDRERLFRMNSPRYQETNIGNIIDKIKKVENES